MAQAQAQSQAEAGAAGTICGAPANQDVSCDFDCYAQHGVACSKSSLVRAAPDGKPLTSN